MFDLPRIARVCAKVLPLLNVVLVFAGLFSALYFCWLSYKTGEIWYNFSNASMLLGLSFGLYFFHRNSYYKKYTDLNFNPNTQIEKIANIISMARTSLVIYSGEFTSNIYESQQLRAALGNLPKGCQISLYIQEEEVDHMSKFLRQFCRDRGISVLQADPARQGHFIVADRKHIRLEYSNKDHSAGQYASYHFWRPDFADHVIENFRRKSLKSTAVKINPSDLPV